jgi:beta-lactam-binding protein with PASTA domain
MKLPWRHHEVSRGQALVEFAVILPILALLLVMAIDFGRVFYGYVALNNAARIAANSAALNPTTWDGSGTTVAKDDYRAEVLRDLQSVNCSPVGGGSWTTAKIPDPVFTSITGTANAYELGDRVTVTLDCAFSFITPLAGNILGNPFLFHTKADFAVRGGIIQGVAVGTALPSPPSCVDAIVPNMVGMSVGAARTAWSGAGFTGTFTPDTSAGKDAETVTAQNTTPSSSAGDCVVKAATVVVTSNSVGPCAAPNEIVPNMINLTVAAARSTWTGTGFTGTFNPTSGSDSDIVTSQSQSPGSCVATTTAVTVGHTAPTAPPPPTCTMPQLVGAKVNNGQSLFNGAKFTGSYTQQAGNGNYTIQFQSLIGGQTYPCTSSVTVGPVAQP